MHHTEVPVYANDWLYALRALRRDPRFTLTAILTLVIGIGCNTAIFSFINTIYLRPLPYPEPDRLVTVWQTAPKGKAVRPRTSASPAAYFSWSGERSLFASTGAWGWDVVTLSGGPWPERVQIQRIAGDYLKALGIQPARGRAFLPEEESGAQCALLVSSRLWRNWLSSDPGIAGRALSVDGSPCAVAGVMPDGFVPPVTVSAHVDAWMPLIIDNAQRDNRTSHSLMVLARLAPGMTFEQVQARLDAEARQTGESIPEEAGWGVQMIPLKEQIVGKLNKALFALAGAVGFLLLLACINVSTLVMSRAAGKRREMAIRSALGASRFRLVSHLLAQSVLFAILGGVGALVVTRWSMDALVAIARETLPRLNEARIDWRVLVFTGAISIASGIAFGLAPALRTAGANLRESVNVRGRRRALRSAQIASEIALAFVLLTGAGLLIRSFQAILAVDLGFHTEHILSANFALRPSHYTDDRQYLNFLGSALERVRGLPGVLAATATVGVPMHGSAGGNFAIFGRTPNTAGHPEAEFRPGDEQYFSTLGITIERGRGFTPHDVEGAPRVALINAKLARLFFGGVNPIGMQIRKVGKNNDLPWMTIVGVVRDTRHIGPLRDSMLEIYVPYAQYRSIKLPPIALVVRTAGEPERILPSIRRAVASVDKDQPLVAVSSMKDDLAQFIGPQRFDTTLLAIFAAIGCRWRRSGFSASCRIESNSGRTRSACEWRWGRRARTCCGWCYRKRCARRRLGSQWGGLERGV